MNGSNYTRRRNSIGTIKYSSSYVRRGTTEWPKLKQEFEMTYIGAMTFLLGMEFIQKPEYICIHQTKYARELLKRFKMESCKAVDTSLISSIKLYKNYGSGGANGFLYRSRVACLSYLIASRHDIMYAASILSRFMKDPSELHLVAAKRVLGYVKDIAAQSTAKAEYIAATAATNHVLWFRKILDNIGFKQEKETILWADKQSDIDIANNPVHHGKTKHTRVRYHTI
ncbi:Uncharacterized protein TCM_045434 [Theobroma cacao]|uniref:Reverse transcriptase Ty1/copia-type domain-containing protein n=1 Tax=Theobroma cacao TaxID=3641 RepID=A0A061FYZ1_THECC|nr:Uncharacterized protein TCM_045434 [Theobroma cacao]